MPSLCCCFLAHPPRRLRRYSVFEIGRNHDYEEERENRRTLERLADRCYLPANALLLELVDRFAGRFRFALALSGVLLDELERHRPDVLSGFRRLADTGCVEFLNETDRRSLAFLHSPAEFREQARMHRRRIEGLFGQRVRTFCNTALLYSDALAATAGALGCEALLAEGTAGVLGHRSPNRLYRPAGHPRIGLLFQNRPLSEAVTRRFRGPLGTGPLLTAAAYARRLHRVRHPEAVVTLVMDYETFGGHQRAETGIFTFLRALPGEVLGREGYGFRTPAEAAAAAEPAGELRVPGPVPPVREGQETSVGQGNALQRDAARALYALERGVRRRGDPALLAAWRMLQIADHFACMDTRWFAEGGAPRGANPFDSPYEAYIHYMNVLADLAQRIHPQKEQPHDDSTRALPL